MNRVAIRWSLWAVALTVGLASLGCGRTEPLRFQVTFEDVDGLEAGMNVTHRGLEIGKVTAVGLDDQGLILVSVTLQDRYRTAVSKDSVIRPESYGMRRRTRLTIEDRDPAANAPRQPVSSGDVLVGTPGLVDDMLGKLQDTARAAWDKTAETATDLGEALDEAAERSLEDWRNLQQERVPALRRQAEGVRKQLEEAGLPEEAEHFWLEFESWLEKLDEPEDEPENEGD